MNRFPRYISLAVAALGFILALPCAAQDSPAALNGTWVMNLAKSKPDKRFPIKAQTVVIAFNDPNIQFQYNTDGMPLAMTFTVDNKEHSSPNPDPKMKDAEIILKASWKKQVLDTQNMSRFGPLGYKMTSMMAEEHWSLSPDGKTITKKVTSDMGPSSLYVYEKQ